MGGQQTKVKGLQVLNELLEKFVAEVNREHQVSPIDFVVYNGDLVWDPYQDAFDNFTRIVSGQKVPAMLVHGNHDGYDDDPKFFQAQKKLSGFEKLNYAFDYGDWRLVFIGAQEKYRSEAAQEKQLEWIRNELSTQKNKKVMMFMHYHVMPVGLSQMEFYSYYPIEFRNQILDLITRYGNVKYVFSGHVHAGVKASVKSSLEYKGTKFINSPTPVKARPFGEEYQAYEKNPKDRYHRRGYYIEVVVDGDEVDIIGHKIDHDFEVKYPAELKKFKASDDPRFFTQEAKAQPNEQWQNPTFDQGLNGWSTSYRYVKDKRNAFSNEVRKGSNVLTLKAPWGAWNFDEYMETYQIVKYQPGLNHVFQYDFRLPRFSPQGAGGYFKFNVFNKQNERIRTLILHWGSQQDRVRFMYQAWFFNADGNRFGSSDYDDEIKAGKLWSVPLTFDKSDAQLLSVDLNQWLKASAFNELNEISHVAVSHGVWSRVMLNESKLKSQLVVNAVNLLHLTEQEVSLLAGEISLNKEKVKLEGADTSIPYFSFHKKK